MDAGLQNEESAPLMQGREHQKLKRGLDETRLTSVVKTPFIIS
jgi:hypothetical protein